MTTARLDDHPDACPCRGMLELLSTRWSALAIEELETGPLRFGEIRRALAGVTPKVLTTTLRRLEDAGLVSRTVIPAVPLHVEYELTELGASAAVPLAALRLWAELNTHDSTPAASVSA